MHKKTTNKSWFFYFITQPFKYITILRVNDFKMKISYSLLFVICFLFMAFQCEEDILSTQEYDKEVLNDFKKDIEDLNTILDVHRVVSELEPLGLK